MGRLTTVRRVIGSYMNPSTFTSLILCLLYAILSVSLPTFNNMDITRIDYNSSSAANGTGGIDQIRFGVWSFCLYRKSLDGDPCHSFTPCDLTGTYRLCSPPSYGYDVRIRLDESAGVYALHVNENWTRALASNAAAGVFALLNSLLILIRRPSTLVAMVAAGTAISAAIISVAFDLFAGNTDGPGMAVSIVLAVISCFQWCFTHVEKDKRTRHLQESSRSSWGLYPGRMIGPVKVVTLNAGEKEGHQLHNDLIGVGKYSTSECGICWETKDVFLALPCTHTFCTRCAKPWIKSLERCPSCTHSTTRQLSDLRRVYCT